MRELSLHVVGADHPNRSGRGNRRFEILLCRAGEPVTLEAEPRNPVDPNAVMVRSLRGVQIGYLAADRAAWIAPMLRAGREMQAIFQQPTAAGAAIRLGFDGHSPTLPQVAADGADDEPDYWPDDLPPDD